MCLVPSDVALHGHVDTWGDREEAERAAWSAPGVTGVTNHIKIGRCVLHDLQSAEL